MPPPPPGYAGAGGLTPPPPGAYSSPPLGAPPAPSAPNDAAWRLDSSTNWSPPPAMPAPQPKREHGTLRVVGIVVGAVAGFLIVGVIFGAIVGKSDGDRAVTHGKWVTAAAPNGTFHADFPAQPVSGAVNTANGTANYLAWPNHAASNYAVEYESFASGATIDVQGALSGAIAGMSNTGAHITSTLDVPFQSNQARAFSGTLNGAPFKGLVFINDHTLYVLLAGGKDEVAQSDRFFNSFILTP